MIIYLLVSVWRPGVLLETGLMAKAENVSTYPVDERANAFVDLHVGTGGELVGGGKPGRKGCVREVVLPLAERRRELLDPLLRSAVALVHRREVLVVDVDTIEVLQEGSEEVEAVWVFSRNGWIPQTLSR